MPYGTEDWGLYGSAYGRRTTPQLTPRQIWAGRGTIVNGVLQLPEGTSLSNEDIAMMMNRGWDRVKVGDKHFKVTTQGIQATDAEGNVTSTNPVEEFQKAYDEAKAANLQLRAELRGGYEALETEARDLLKGMGEAERTRIGRITQKLKTEGMQDLVSSGLYGSSLKYGVRQGAARFQAEQEQELGERLRGQELGVLTGIRGAKLGAMEREAYTYPGLDLLAQLATAYGQWGGGVQGQPRLNYGGAAGGGAGGVGATQPWGMGMAPITAVSNPAYAPAQGRAVAGGGGGLAARLERDLGWQAGIERKVEAEEARRRRSKQVYPAYSTGAYGRRAATGAAATAAGMPGVPLGLYAV